MKLPSFTPIRMARWPSLRLCNILDDATMTMDQTTRFLAHFHDPRWENIIKREIGVGSFGSKTTSMSSKVYRDDVLAAGNEKSNQICHDAELDISIEDLHIHLGSTLFGRASELIPLQGSMRWKQLPWL